MTSAQNIGSMALLLFLGQAIAAGGTAVVPEPSVPLNKKFQCPLTMLQTQALAKDCRLGTDGKPTYECDGIKVEAGCGEWRRLPVDAFDHSGLGFVYYIDNLERTQTFRHIEIDLYRMPLNAYLLQGANSQLLQDENDALILSPDGVPQLSKSALVGDCGQDKTRRIEVSPIQGANWSGWMYEQVFTAPKKKLPARCETSYTPQYRCVTLLFGNNKVAATLPNYCFLRKKVNDLRVELSFDVFMEMIQTIRFDEGEVVPLELKATRGK